jgi:hypothetical protein
VVLAVSPSSDPCQSFQKKDVRTPCSSREGGRGARMKLGGRDRDVRGSIASAPWEEYAHAHHSRP